MIPMEPPGAGNRLPCSGAGFTMDVNRGTHEKAGSRSYSDTHAGFAQQRLRPEHYRR
ncbi:hypothetical protein DESC_480135 [Desulfosarcina cetonica]|nr:hypothetical protein DESC_480135 [Desulfosarcina cetonica]